MIDQAATGIKEQDNQELVAAEADQLFEERGCISRGSNRSALAQFFLKRPCHQVARPGQRLGSRFIRIVRDNRRVGAEQFGQSGVVGAQSIC